MTVFIVLHFVKRFVWDFLNSYSYYRDFFCLGPASRLCERHCHGWVRYIDTTKITVWCMSSLLLSIDLRWLCYFIMFDFKLTNGAMMKWRMLKWCNGETRIRIGCFVSSQISNLFICFIFEHKMFVAEKAIHNIQFLITNNKYSNQVYIIKPTDQ